MFDDEDDFDESPEKLNEIRASHVKQFEEMLSKKENRYFDVDVLNNIIDDYIERDEAAKALETARYAIKMHPTALWFLLREANILSRQNQHLLALERLNHYELVCPVDVDFLIIKGHVLGNMEQFAESLKCFQQALELSDENKDAIYHDISFLYSDMGNYSMAIKYMKTYIKNGNDDMLCYDQLIQWHILADRLAECIAFFNQRIDVNPYSDIAWLCLGTVFKELRKYSDALYAIDYSLIIEPNNVHAFIEQGEVNYLMQRYEPALESYKKAIELWPTHALTLYNIGECYENLNDYESARSYYHQAVKAQPDLSAAWYAIGMILVYKEKWYDAIHYLKKALESDSGNPEYWFALGDCESNLFHFKEAKACYENVIELEPASEDIWIEYSMLLFENNYVEDAIYVIQEGIKMHPDMGEFYYYLAGFLYANSEIKEAYIELETALEKDFKSYPILFEINDELKQDENVQKLIDLKENQQ